MAGKVKGLAMLKAAQKKEVAGMKRVPKAEKMETKMLAEMKKGGAVKKKGWDYPKKTGC